MRRPLLFLSGLAIALAIAACGQATGGAPSAAASSDPNATTIVARDLRFEQSSYTAPAGRAFTVVFDNRESVPHNVTIAKDDGFGQKVFEGEIFSGPGSRTYSVGPLAAGTYPFRCDVHPDMKGTLVVR